jgi:tetratricopeptide (TPR) repeat protein
MPDAQELLQQGVTAILEENDLKKARDLIKESIQYDPQNDVAWVWMARTIRDPEKRLKMLERALELNPDNRQTLKIKAELIRRYPKELGGDAGENIAHQATGASTFTPTPGVKTVRDKLTPVEEKQIADLIKKGNNALAQDAEEAIGYWLEALHIQADNPGAFPLIVRQLIQLNYHDDAEELAWRALEAGTPEESIARVIVSLTRRNPDEGKKYDNYMRLAMMPHVPEDLLVELCDEFYQTRGLSQSFDLVSRASASHPDSQKLLTRLAHLYEEARQEETAQDIYKRIVTIDYRSPEGKLADKKLAHVTIPLSDKERGSVLLALREAFGITVLYVLMAWQDAGLNLANLGAARLVGIGISFVAGYILVTGSSSHQQKGVASALGGKIDEASDSQLPSINQATRSVLITIGAIGLAVAFYLVFTDAIGLLLDPVEPTGIPTLEEILEEVEAARLLGG